MYVLYLTLRFEFFVSLNMISIGLATRDT